MRNGASVAIAVLLVVSVGCATDDDTDTGGAGTGAAAGGGAGGDGRRGCRAPDGNPEVDAVRDPPFPAPDRDERRQPGPRDRGGRARLPLFEAVPPPGPRRPVPLSDRVAIPLPFGTAQCGGADDEPPELIARLAGDEFTSQ